MAQVGPYETLEVLGRGGQGLVARARDVRTGAVVALKVVVDDLDPTARARLEREARALASLDHPNLARLVDHGTHQGRPWLALAYVRGKTLEEIRRAGSPAPAWSLRVTADVAHALSCCHAAGLVHRDVKPSNIVIEDVTGRPVLVDFGLVRDRRPSQSDGEPLTLSGELVGTPAYMAPEQADPRGAFGRVGPWTDVHALGATLHFLLTGRPPFSGATLVELLARLLEQPAPAPSASATGVPPAVDALVLRALDKQAHVRPTAEELARALEAALDPDRGPAVRTPRVGRRARSLPLVAAALALAALGVARVVASAERREDTSPAPPAAPPAPPAPVAGRAPGPWPASTPGGEGEAWAWRLGDGAAPPWAPALWEAEDLAAPAALAARDPAAARAAFGESATLTRPGRVLVRYASAQAPLDLDPVWQGVGQAALFAVEPLATSTPEGTRLVLANDSGVAFVPVGRAVWDAPALGCQVRAGRPVDRDLVGLTTRPAASAPCAVTLEARSGALHLKASRGETLAAVVGLGPGWTRLGLAAGGPAGARLVVGEAGLPALERLDEALVAPVVGATVGLVLDEVELLARDLEVEGTPRTVDRAALAGPVTAPPGRVALAFSREPGRGGPLVALEDEAGRRVTLGLDGAWLRLRREEGARTELLAEEELGDGAEGWLWLEAGGGALRGRGRAGDRELDVAAADPWCGPWVRAGWGSTGPRVRVVDAEVGGPPAADPPGAVAWRSGARALAGLACPRRLDPAALPAPGPGRWLAVAGRARPAAEELERFVDGLGGASATDPAGVARRALVRADALGRAALARALAGERAQVERLGARLLTDGATFARRAVAALGPPAEQAGPDLVDQLVSGWGPAAPLDVRGACLALALVVAPARRGDILAQEGSGEHARFDATGDDGARERALSLYAAARAAGANLTFVAPREAELLWRTGRLEEARALYDVAVRLDSRNGSIWRGRGGVLQALGREEEGLVSLLGALSANRRSDLVAAEIRSLAETPAVGPGVRAAALWVLSVTLGDAGEVRAIEAQASELRARPLPPRELDLLAFVLGDTPPEGSRPTATLARARRGDEAALAALPEAATQDELVRHLARLRPELASLVR